MRILIPVVFITLLLFHTSLATAEIVSTSFMGTAFADFAGSFDNDSSALDSDTIQALGSAQNSFSQSDLGWLWDTDVLIGNGLLIAEKTQSAKPGGLHTANADLVFQFTVDSQTNYSLNGFWGFDNLQAGGDVLSVTLADSNGTIDSDSTTSNTGINSDTMLMFGTLDPGTYTLTINAALSETINNQGLGLAGWNLTSFELTDASAIPEPGFFVLFSLALCGLPRRSQTKTTLQKN